MDERKKGDNVEKVTTERIRKERAIAEQNILRASQKVKEEGGR